MLASKPKPKNDFENETDVEDLVDEIGGMIEWENAGFPTDWKCYPFEFQILFMDWRNTENDLRKFKEERQHADFERQIQVLGFRG